MSNAQNIETIPAADAFMVMDWIGEGYFSDLDAAWNAYQQAGVIGFLFGDGARKVDHVEPSTQDEPSGPEFPGAMRAYDDRPEWLR